jgi:hypothetical protein
MYLAMIIGAKLVVSSILPLPHSSWQSSPASWVADRVDVASRPATAHSVRVHATRSTRILAVFDRGTVVAIEFAAGHHMRRRRRWQCTFCNHYRCKCIQDCRFLFAGWVSHSLAATNREMKTRRIDRKGFIVISLLAQCLYCWKWEAPCITAWSCSWRDFLVGHAHPKVMPSVKTAFKLLVIQWSMHGRPNARQQTRSHTFQLTEKQFRCDYNGCFIVTMDVIGIVALLGVPVNGSKRRLSVIRSIICAPARFSSELL